MYMHFPYFFRKTDVRKVLIKTGKLYLPLIDLGIECQ